MALPQDPFLNQTMPKTSAKQAAEVNEHGVCIAELSSVHKRFGKASGVPQDVTRAECDAWVVKARAAEAGIPAAVAAHIPKDVGLSGCWLGARVRALQFADGTRAYSDEDIETLNFSLGRRALFHGKDAWKDAGAVYASARAGVAEREAKHAVK